jgi:hypothetical protein
MKNQKGEQLTITELAESLGKPVSVIGDLFQDTLSGLLNSKTVRQHVKTNAAMSTLRRKIKGLRIRIEGDDDVTLAELAGACNLPVEYVSTYFFAKLHGRTPLTRIEAS